MRFSLRLKSRGSQRHRGLEGQAGGTCGEVMLGWEGLDDWAEFPSLGSLGWSRGGGEERMKEGGERDGQRKEHPVCSDFV